MKQKAKTKQGLSSFCQKMVEIPEFTVLLRSFETLQIF